MTQFKFIVILPFLLPGVALGVTAGFVQIILLYFAATFFAGWDAWCNERSQVMELIRVNRASQTMRPIPLEPRVVPPEPAS